MAAAIDAARERMAGHAIVLFDGQCGLCNRSIRLLLRHDRSGRLLFAPLESPLAAELLAHHNLAAANMESVALIIAPGSPTQQIALGPDAIGHALFFADPPWPVLGRLILTVPRRLRDPVYRLVARIRYRLFGRYASCPVPTPEERSRFLGI